MGHNTGSQQMPKKPLHLTRRGNVWWFIKRIPSDLVRAKVYGKATKIKVSLETPDFQKAQRLALSKALEVDEDFQAKRRALASKENANCAMPKRPLSSLTALERGDFIRRAFLSLEAVEAPARRRAASITDPEERRDAVEEAGLDWTVLEGASPHYAPIDWKHRLSERLAEVGVEIDPEAEGVAAGMADELRRAGAESAFRTLRGFQQKPFEERDPLFKGLRQETASGANPPPDPKGSKTIEDLCTHYLEHGKAKAESGKAAASNLAKRRLRARVLIEFFGQTHSLGSIGKGEAAKLAAFLPTIPTNAAKRYPGLPLRDAANKEASKAAPKLLHPKTVSDLWEGLISLFAHAEEMEWIETNPLRGRLLRDLLPKVLQSNRTMLTPEELSKMLASEEFLEAKDGTREAQAARFWLPLLCLFQGARANEIACLKIEDVGQAKGISFIHIRRGLKTAASERRVPLHREILRQGFLDFVAKRKAADPLGWLFPGLEENKNGSRADGVCKWWGRRRDKITGKAKKGAIGGGGIHSLRHSWKRAAVEAGMPQEILNSLGGWSSKGSGVNASFRYGLDEDGSPFPLKTLKQHLDRVNPAAIPRPTAGPQE